MKIKKENKRGQVTLFVILAIIIVAVLIILFYPRLKDLIGPSTPSLQLQGCVEKKLNEAVFLVSQRGGSVEPVNGYMYKGEKVEYLCYTNQYYQTCVMQQPLLKQHIEREILDYIREDVKGCVSNLRSTLEKRGYSVSGEKDEISLSIEPGGINIEVSGFTARNDELGVSYDNFKITKATKLYNLLMLTTSILNWEARYGDSETTTYMLYYPNVKVEKLKQSDGSKIYILTNTQTQDKFTFATRSLSWPPGYGFGQIYTPKE